MPPRRIDPIDRALLARRVASMPRDAKLALLGRAVNRERNARIDLTMAPPKDGSVILRVPSGDGRMLAFRLSPDDADL